MTEINYKGLIEETSFQENEFLKTKESLVAMGFSIRTQNCLYNGGIVNLEDLLNKTRKDLVRIPNLGRRSILEIENSLKELNIKELIKIVHSAKINKNKISSKNQKILNMWNSAKHTYETIGKEFGVSRERIRQILVQLKNKGFEVIDTKKASLGRKENYINEQTKYIDNNQFIRMFHDGFTKEDMCNHFSISREAYKKHKKSLISNGEISNKKRILEAIKSSIEDVDSITKNREITILKMRRENYSLDEIAEVLNLSKIRLAQIVKNMKDKGYEIPNSRYTGKSLPHEEIILRVNKIEHCLEKGMNIRQISHVINVSQHEIKRLIYKHLVNLNE